MKKWKCNVCGYIHEGDAPPEKCPVCGADASHFEEVAAPEPGGQPAAGQAASAEVPPTPEDPRAVEMGPEPAESLGRILYFATGQILKHHLHPISTHIPNGILPVVFIFIMLAMLTESPALGKAAYYNLVFVVLSLPVVLYSGYVEWQKRYKGFLGRQFVVKIACAAIVFGLSVVAVIWWSVNPDILQVPSSGRTLFILLNLLMLGAAGVAGFIGGKLVFRD